MQKAVVYLALFLAFACLVIGLLLAGDIPALTSAERDRERIENAAREAKLALLDAGCLGAGISGSGSAAFGIASDRDTAKAIAAGLRGRWSWVEAAPTLPSAGSLLIQDAMENLRRGRTTIIIAHRLSTIEHADRIVVLSNGEIAEIGTHSELIEKGGIYNKLYQIQFST